MKKTLHSNGKLLLTGEYVVLGGASALAIPTKHGQSLEVSSNLPTNIASETYEIQWKSFNEKEIVWFEDVFSLKDFKPKNSENPISKTLSKILLETKKLNPDFLSKEDNISVITKLDFPRNWGLGTSSTLINNIAQWANIDAFELLKNSFGGSGYDIAAAQNDSPILYKLREEKAEIKKTHLPWGFTDSLFFVHLNQKQDSKEGIARYKNASVDEKSIQRISDISHNLLRCNSLSEFEKLMNLHESIISEIINLPTIKVRLFSDYPNTIKSLGAWGGDFVLVTGDENDMDYFIKKGFGTVISFEKMIKTYKL